MCVERNKDRVFKILKNYAYQSQSYSILRGDKKYFFSKTGIDGVIAYVVHAKIALAAGDPLCNPDNLREFTIEFRKFCSLQKWRCCFQAVTDRFKNILEKIDFGLIKIGEEPIFDLKKLSWEGGKFKNLRNDIRSAKKHDLSVVEYCPLVERRQEWEKQMERLSADWIKFKGSGEFSFLIGKPSLSDPKERKYFLALNNNQIESFVVCTPIFTRNGIYFDLMRRKERTIRGTNQLLITETFKLLKEQGYTMATLGTAPLSNDHVDDPRQSYIIDQVLKLAFNHLGYFHRLKPIYKFKKQFGPTSWESRYLAFSPHWFNPIMLYTLLKAYDPSGVKGTLLRQIQKLIWQGIRTLDKVPKKLINKLKGN